MVNLILNCAQVPNQSGEGGGAPPSSGTGESTSQSHAATNQSGGGGEAPPASSTAQSHAATNQSGGGGGAPPSSSTGESHAATNQSGGGGGGAQPPSNAGQSGSAHGSNNQPNRPPPPPEEGNGGPFDQPNSGAEEEVGPFPDDSAVLVVQADVRQIKITNQMSDDEGELVFTLPNVIDPGGGVQCAPSILPCNSSISSSSSHSEPICRAPIAVEEDSTRVLSSYPSCRKSICTPQPPSHSLSAASTEIEFDADEDPFLTEAQPAAHSVGNVSALVLTNPLPLPLPNQNLASVPLECSEAVFEPMYLSLDNSVVVLEHPPRLLSQQEHHAFPLPSSHSSLVASSEIESGDEDLYWTESQEAVHGEGATSVLVLTNMPHLPFEKDVTTLSSSAYQEATLSPP